MAWQARKDMTEFLAQYGIDVGAATAIYIICAAYVFFVISLIWLTCQLRRSKIMMSMMDGFYGWAYASVGWIAYVLAEPTSVYAGLLLLMSSLHGARLGHYLFKRWLVHCRTGVEAERYVKINNKFSSGYWWKSFFVIMHPQTILIMVVSLPVIYGISSPTDVSTLTPLAFLGMAIFGTGLYYEWLADGQLEAFKADPANKGRYLETGVWALTRHPNYFGNTTVWWGIWIVCFAGHPELWWTIASPMFNTFMLTKVLGSAFQDKFMGDRPEYKALMAKRGAFFPKFW